MALFIKFGSWDAIKDGKKYKFNIFKILLLFEI